MTAERRERGEDALSGTGLEVSTPAGEGDPKRLLVEVAEEWKADCIFVGATGTSGPLTRFLPGSVSSAVVARAHCSVEVIRTQALADD